MRSGIGVVGWWGEKARAADDGMIFIFSSDWNVSRDAVWGPPTAAECASVGG